MENGKWAGAVISNSTIDREEHHLGGMVEAWGEEKFTSRCGLGYNAEEMLVPKLHLCDNAAVLVKVETRNAFLTYVCTKCGYHHKEMKLPYYLHAKYFDEVCRRYKTSDPTDIDSVINDLVKDSLRCKLNVSALRLFMAKEQAETFGLYLTRGMIQQSEIVYTLRRIAQQYIKSDDCMECTLLKDAFLYYASEIYKQWHKYHIAEQLYRAERFEDKLKVMVGDCLYNQMNYTKYIEDKEVLTTEMRLRYCMKLEKSEYDSFVLSAVCHAEYEKLM